MPKKLLITGGAGFIGSAVVRHALGETDWSVLNVDKLTYAGNRATLAAFEDDARYRFEQADICDAGQMEGLFASYRPDAVMHLAAESHVDRSIEGPGEFVQTNIVGTYVLLQAALEYFDTLRGDHKNDFRFHHVSTDEVFGSLGETGRFTETSPYQPNSPYSASKASSDHLVRAWHETYGLPTVMSNCSNNYGPYQYPEKLIPVVMNKALTQAPIPIYGKGDNVRDWLYVDDHARALFTILTKGRQGESYNVGGDEERSNLQLVEILCEVLDAYSPRDDGKSYAEQISFVTDRPGHDMRYAIDPTKIRGELGWKPIETLHSGLKKTVQWYAENHAWIDAVTSKSYDGARLGLRSAQHRA